MPTLDWIWKSAVVSHHKAVPHRLVNYDKALPAGKVDEGIDPHEVNNPQNFLK